MEGLKKQIEEVRKIRILDNTKEAEMNQKEQELMNEFTSLRPIRKKQQEDLKALKNKIQTMQTIDTNFQVTRTKNFEFWYETMIKKMDFESKYGKRISVTKRSSMAKRGSIIRNSIVFNIKPVIDKKDFNIDSSETSSVNGQIKKKTGNKKVKKRKPKKPKYELEEDPRHEEYGYTKIK